MSHQDTVHPLSDVTPLILTHDEAANIERVLAALSWARSIVVIDSGSTDATLEILGRHEAVRVVHRAFDDHTTQWNFGLDQVGSPWVLALDADYVLTDELTREMAETLERPTAEGYAVPFRYCVGGRPLRASLYPPRVVLFRRDRGRYVQDGHTQRLRVDGRVAPMRSYVFHDDRKSLTRWLEAQQRYALLEAAKLSAGDARLSRVDLIRRAGFVAPFLAFLSCLFVRGVILDGRRGVYYALQRLYAETLLALRLYERELESRAGQPTHATNAS
jgi:glycosyltransferase involved in cell wall biosynthesis